MFRHQIHARPGPGVDAVVIPRRELFDASFVTLTNDFRNVWRRGVDRLVAQARG